MSKTFSDKEIERKGVLVKEMYEIFASSSAEMERLEAIIDELIPLSEDDKTSQLVMMSVDVRKYRIKFSTLVSAIFDKKFNIVELCKQRLAKD